jgi:hypothetical protein
MSRPKRLCRPPCMWSFPKRHGPLPYFVTSLPHSLLVESFRIKMPLLHQGPTNWQPARQKMRGPVELHCPPCRCPCAALCIDAHVNGVARLLESKFVLHRQTHVPQCIAHLLLTRRRVDRHPNKGCLTRWPEFHCQGLYDDREVHIQALYHVARDENLMQLAKTRWIIETH